MFGLTIIVSACSQQLPKDGQEQNEIEKNETASNHNQNNEKSEDLGGDWKTYNNTNTQDPNIIGATFSIKYPSSWTYQEFRCNLHGVAFCPLAGNSASNCGVTCGMDSPDSPIYLYPLRGEPVINESENIKYWKDPNISLDLVNDQYRDIYNSMITTFEFTK